MDTENNTMVREIDEALAIEHASIEKQNEERLEAAVKEREKMSRIGTVLRSIGVAVLMAAIGTFMFQRWSDMTHMSRYFAFLAFTAGVCASGLLCGLKIGENKGARTLLGAVVVLMPVHSAQIGAILFSRLGRDVYEAQYPSYFYWSVPSLTDALLVAIVGIVIMLPMAYMAYSVLARNYARKLLLIGCAVSSVLLIPTRDPVFVGLFMLVAGFVACIGELRLSSIVELKTREACIARSVPFIAIVMLIGRQSALYQASGFFQGLIFAFMSAIIFEVIPRITRHKAIARLSEIVSIYTTAISAYLVGDAALSGFDLQDSVLAPLVIGFPLSVLFALMAERAREASGLFRVASALALFIAGMAEIVGGEGVEACVIALVVSIVAVAYACITEQKGILLAGTILTMLSLCRGCVLAVGSLSFSPWIVLGVIGVGTIVGASYLERNFGRMRESLFAARRRVSSWR